MARRKLIVAENMTCNGIIEFAEPWFDPGDQDDTDQLDVARRHMATEDTLLLGRRTFEQFRAYWPHQSEDRSGSTAHLNKVQKYVFSSSMHDPGWENSTVVRGPVEETVRTLQNGPGGDIGITGSISLVHALMQANLVDEWRLFVYPVLGSHGRNLVPAGLSLRGLELAECSAFRSGVVLLTYTRA